MTDAELEAIKARERYLETTTNPYPLVLTRQCKSVAPLIAALEAANAEPHLGSATTQELLDELRARIEVDYFAGGGGLDYTTVKGRPDTTTAHDARVGQDGSCSYCGGEGCIACDAAGITR